MQDPVEITAIAEDDAGQRLDKALARHLPEVEGAALSRSRLARLIADGHVRVDGAPATDPAQKVPGGARLTLRLPPPAPTHIAPEAIPLDIVHDDPHLAVVDKPAGMVVHPAPGAASGTLVNALLHHYAGALSGVGGVARPGIVHRIDKDTSGLLVVAKTDAAHRGLAAQFEAHTAARLYTAVCHGVPDPGDPRLMGLPGVEAAAGRLRIATRLGRHPTDRQRQAVLRTGGRAAVTHVQVLAAYDGAARIACRLETGRTHQIRVHLAHVGHPLVGDPTYGRRRATGPAAALLDAFPRQALHAGHLGFTHPVTGAALRFDSPLPRDLAELVAALDGGGD